MRGSKIVKLHDRNVQRCCSRRCTHQSLNSTTIPPNAPYMAHIDIRYMKCFKMVGQLVIVFVVPYLERSIERYSRLIKSLQLLHSYKEKNQNVKSFEKNVLTRKLRSGPIFIQLSGFVKITSAFYLRSHHQACSMNKLFLLLDKLDCTRLTTKVASRPSLGSLTLAARPKGDS
jgi:hypothetical protein